MSESKSEVQRRQYVIHYRRGTGPYGQLEPNVHEGLYKRPQVAFGVAIMQANTFVEGLVIRLDDENFMLTTLGPGVINDKAFTFDTKTKVKGLHLPGKN
jgi:hypothetical protein